MKTPILAALLCLPLAALVRADDTIPKPLSPDRYEALWLNPPFLRSLNAAESYAITGVSNIDGKPIVTLSNTSTGERFMLSNVRNSQGWRLISLRADANPKNVMARVSVCDEEMTVRFDEKQLSSIALLKAAQGVTGQAPSGNPAARQLPTPPKTSTPAKADPKAAPLQGNFINQQFDPNKSRNRR